MDGITVTGLREAIALAKSVPEEVNRQMRRSLDAAALSVLAAARAAAPRKTGNLAASGHIERTGFGAEQVASVVFGGSEAPYAVARMYARRHGHHPDPFLARANALLAGTITARARDDFDRLIERLSRA